jgi:TolB protein
MPARGTARRSRPLLFSTALLTTFLLAVFLLATAGSAAAQGPAGAFDGLLLRASDAGAKALEVPLPIRVERVLSTSGRGLLVTAEPRAGTVAGDLPTGREIWKVDLDGRHPQRLLGEGRGLRASWSEKASLLAVVTRDFEIRLLHEDGREVKTLARHGTSPAFSPDGTRLAYAALPAGWSGGSNPGRFDLRVLDLKTGRDRLLTSGYDDAEPIWRPDGRSLLFLSGGRTGLTSLWSIRLDGKGLRQLTQVGERELDPQTFVPNPSANTETSWSPDGGTLLYGAQYTPEGEVIALTFGAEGEVREMRDLGAGLHPVCWPCAGKTSVRRWT